MKIKIGTVKEDVTAYGNRYYVQIEDQLGNNNSDLSDLVGEKVTVVVGDVMAAIDFATEQKNAEHEEDFINNKLFAK